MRVADTTSAPAGTETAPSGRDHPRPGLGADRGMMTAAAVVVMLVASAVCVAVAPGLMPDSYSVVEHSVSESAAQGVNAAWVARLGFLLLGFGVLVEASIADGCWGVAGRIVHRLYGISMIAAATFAHSPWEGASFDAFEDFLHSVAAFAVGFTFTAGVVIVTLRRGRGAGLARAFDGLAIVAAVALPMVMFNVTDVAGLVQRLLFSIGYLWYGSEALRLGRTQAASRHAAAERG